MELITAQKHAAEINYSETGSSSIASVGSTIENLSYVLDNSMETKARIVKVVDVIGRTTIAVKFNEIGGGQPVGAIISNPAFVANIGLLSQISVAAYNKGNVVADNTTSGGLASVEVIGDEGLSTIEVTPQSPFDEVRITIPSLAEVAEVVNVHGFYTRPDLNNNGIPDCSEVPEDQNSVKVVDWTKHTCVNNMLLGSVAINLSGVETGSTYSAHLICYPFNGIGETVEVDATSTQADSNGEAVLNIQLPVGDYSISGLPYNGIHVQVHSLKTTWKKNPAELRNQIMRALGILRSCYSISHKEFLELFAKVKLGISLGFVNIKNEDMFNDLLEQCASGALQVMNKMMLPTEQIDIKRAELLVQTFKTIY